MMTHKITIMALIAGIFLGAAATEGFNVYRQSQDSYRQSQNSRIFQERAHCKAVADAYVKENTNLNDNSVTGRSVTLEKVDYSPARNSCVAELEEGTYFRGGALVFESVRDLLSGDTLFSVNCTKDCVEELQKMQFVDPAFNYVMNNADEPVALGKQYVQMQSELHKATAPASSVAVPNDWKTVPAKEYDAQGKPIQIDPVTGERIQAPASQHKPAPPSRR
jgi:hypothetical protein